VKEVLAKYPPSARNNGFNLRVPACDTYATPAKSAYSAVTPGWYGNDIDTGDLLSISASAVPRLIEIPINVISGNRNAASGNNPCALISSNDVFGADYSISAKFSHWGGQADQTKKIRMLLISVSRLLPRFWTTGASCSRTRGTRGTALSLSPARLAFIGAYSMWFLNMSIGRPRRVAAHDRCFVSASRQFC